MNPAGAVYAPTRVAEGLKATLVLLFYNLVFLLIFVLIAGIWIPFQTSGIQELSESLEYWQRIVLFCMIAPLAEEIIFRLPLKWNLLGIVCSIMMVGFLLYRIILPGTDFGTIAGLVTFLSLVFYMGYKFLGRLKDFYHRYYSYIFYSYLLLFALLHIFNFDQVSPWAIVVLMLPFLVSACCMAYLRLKYGFAYGFLLHALSNLVLLL